MIKDFICPDDGCNTTLVDVYMPSAKKMERFQKKLRCQSCGQKMIVWLGNSNQMVPQSYANPGVNFKWGIRVEKHSDIDKAERKFHEPNKDRLAEAYLREDRKLAAAMTEEQRSEAQYAT